MKITLVAAIVLMLVTPTQAMDFTIKAPGTITASGPIVFLDAARFRKVADSMGDRFDTLVLNSPGGIVAEAMRMVDVMDEHQPIRALVSAGATCASACAQVLYVSARYHEVLPGGRLGVHSCRNAISGVADEVCNKNIAANAILHGIAPGPIGAARITVPAGMFWFDADQARCWGLVKTEDDDAMPRIIYDRSLPRSSRAPGRC